MTDNSCGEGVAAMHDMVIYGAGGQGREVAEMVRRINDRHRVWSLIGFIDDGVAAESVWGGRGVLGGFNFAADYGKPLDVVLAIADPKSKKRIYESLKRYPHISFPNIIDCGVELSSSVVMGEGVIISHQCSISVDVTLGSCILINTASIVGHDSVVGDFCSVMSNVNISGSVRVGDGVFIGVGSSIRQGITVGADSVVGMGSVVVADVQGGSTVLGNPARKVS